MSYLERERRKHTYVSVIVRNSVEFLPRLLEVRLHALMTLLIYQRFFAVCTTNVEKLYRILSIFN